LPARDQIRDRTSPIRVFEREAGGNAQDGLGQSTGPETAVAGSDAQRGPCNEKSDQGSPAVIEHLLEPRSTAVGLAELGHEVVDLGGPVAPGGEPAHPPETIGSVR
jgi:hypothetical protein